jgi:hypothetical protein
MMGLTAIVFTVAYITAQFNSVAYSPRVALIFVRDPALFHSFGLFVANAFDIARLRGGAAEKHPPHIVYVMLFGLGLGGSLLAGFGMAAAKARSWIHMVGFAATLAATLYVITDLEFPRLGLVRIDDFDHFLVDVYEKMRVRE